MNPRELLARLNVPAVRYDIGKGGIPELTNVDIAGALGMVQDEFARDVFTALWWEDGAKRARIDLGRRIVDLMIREFNERCRALTIAKLEQHQAQEAIKGKRRPTAFDDKIIRACERAVESAKNRSWTYNPAVYCRIPPAIIHEIYHPRLCDACRGRGEIQAGALKVLCRVCSGTRTKPEKAIERAKLIRIEYQNYRQRWCKVYEWAYDLVKRAEDRAARAFAKAVSREEAA